MRTVKHRGLIKFTIALTLLLILLSLSTRFIPFSLDSKAEKKAFKNFPFQPQHQSVKFKDGILHYVTIGDSTLTPLLLIHGSPGSWDNYVDLITNTPLSEHYYIIAIDRPGYNHTTLKSGNSLEKQSLYLAPIMHQYFKNKGVIIGHSYGGALALQVAINYNDYLEAVIIVAGAVAAPYQKPKWYNYLAKFPPISWLISHKLLASNAEMIQLSEDLLELERHLSTLKQKVVLIHGKKDILVNYKSATYLKERLNSSQVKLYIEEDMNHFVIWTNKKLIIEALEWTRE